MICGEHRHNTKRVAAPDVQRCQPDGCCRAARGWLAQNISGRHLAQLLVRQHAVICMRGHKSARGRYGRVQALPRKLQQRALTGEIQKLFGHVRLAARP